MTQFSLDPHQTSLLDVGHSIFTIFCFSFRDGQTFPWSFQRSEFCMREKWGESKIKIREGRGEGRKGVPPPFPPHFLFLLSPHFPRSHNSEMLKPSLHNKRLFSRARGANKRLLCRLAETPR